MDVTFADKLGTEDKQILGISIKDGELELQLDKPETIGWQELIYFVKYVIANALAEESELSAGDIFQWLGAHGKIADEVAKTSEELIEEARQKRLREIVKKEKERQEND